MRLAGWRCHRLVKDLSANRGLDLAAAANAKVCLSQNISIRIILELFQNMHFLSLICRMYRCFFNALYLKRKANKYIVCP